MGTYSLLFTLRAALVTFTSILFVVSCASNRPLQRVILTKGMLKNYKISTEELKKLQFYLGDTVELQGDTTWYKNNRKSIEYHAVDLASIKENRTVVFPAGTPGKLHSADPKFGLTGTYVSITINFGIAYGGENYNLLLTFSPNINGRYTLDHACMFNYIRLKRKGLRYNCTQGCRDNYLWVSGTENKGQSATRWQASGNSFYYEERGSRR